MNNMKSEQKKQDCDEAYVDSNLFIYAALDNGFVGKEAKRILRKVKEGNLKIFTATLTVDEFLWRVQKGVGRELASKAASVFFTLFNLELVNVDSRVVSDSVDLYKTEKLDPRDVIHLAAMRSKKLKVIMSSDSDFDQIKGIKRVDFSRK